MSMSKDRTAFQIGLDSVGKIAHPRDYVKEVSSSLSEAKSFLQSFKSVVNQIIPKLSGRSKIEFETLSELIRFSDPVSVTQSAEIEQQIINSTEDFLANISGPEEDLLERIEELKGLLVVRNQICKESK